MDSIGSVCRGVGFYLGWNIYRHDQNQGDASEHVSGDGGVFCGIFRIVPDLWQWRSMVCVYYIPLCQRYSAVGGEQTNKVTSIFGLIIFFEGETEFESTVTTVNGFDSAPMKNNCVFDDRKPESGTAHFS